MPPTAAAPTPPPSKLPGFAPSPEQARQIFEDLDNPTYSFFALAHRHKTDQESLSLWLARPEIAERVNALESSVARRTRYVALSSFTSALHAAALILSDFTSPTDLSTAPPCPRETALRAARFILRISQFAPGAVATRPPKPTTPPPNQVQPHAQPERQSKPEPKSESSSALDPIAHATKLVQTLLCGTPHPQPLSNQSNALTTNPNPTPTQPPTPHQVPTQQNPGQQLLTQLNQNDAARNEEPNNEPDDENEDDPNDDAIDDLEDDTDEWLQSLTPEAAHRAAQNLVTQGILTPTEAAQVLQTTGFTTHPP